MIQMPRTVAAIEMVKEAMLPYVVILTDPTTGGVSASFAMVGDIHIAEPGATIGFAGRRVIEETVRETLPEDFQTAEYLLEHGMVDMVVPRSEIKQTLVNIISILYQANVWWRQGLMVGKEPETVKITRTALKQTVKTRKTRSRGIPRVHLKQKLRRRNIQKLLHRRVQHNLLLKFL